MQNTTTSNGLQITNKQSKVNTSNEFH